MSCITPINVQMKESTCFVTVPCGKCPACRSRRASGWSFRLMQQEKIAQSAIFLTLTYDTDFVPITKNGFMGLDKTHLQKFFKRLRKRHDRDAVPIKYYAVGEYGGITFRPHYHIILFNVQSELIVPSWQMGHVHFGTVTAQSVGYTLKYISKPGRIPLHRNDDRQPEFSLMSKGLGSNYLTDAIVDWHKNDLENRMYCTLKDGKKIAMPRYYKNKIYTSEEKGYLKGVFEEKRKLDDYQKVVNGEVPTPFELQQKVDAAISRAKYRSQQKQKI